MPSKDLIQKTGFLKTQLMDGVKPFRYRGGVRTLLGMCEAKEDLPRFAQILPPTGFRYREMAQKSGPAADGRTWRENRDHTFIQARSSVSQKMTQERGLRNGVVFQTPESLAPFENQDATPTQKTKPDTPERDSADQDSSDTNLAGSAEETFVDIPGFSKSPQIFPALKSVEEVQQVEKNEKLPVTKLQPTHNHAKNEAPFGETALLSPCLENKTPVPADAEPLLTEEIRGRIPKSLPRFRSILQEKHVQKIETQTIRPLQSRVPSGNEIAQGLESQETPHDYSLVFDTHSSSAGRPVPQDVRAQIRKLRQAVHTLKKKNATLEKNQDTDDAEQINQSAKTPERQAAPVVIVKQAPPQSKTPPAFWERRYLSHAALRLRILR